MEVVDEAIAVDAPSRVEEATEADAQQKAASVELATGEEGSAAEGDEKSLPTTRSHVIHPP